MRIEERDGFLVLRPEGDIGASESAILLERIKRTSGGLEFDFSGVDSLDLAALQLVLVAVASARNRGRSVIVTDSASKVLRSTLELAGVRPEKAGLSAELVL